MMFGSLLWAMVDIWPGQEIDWSIELVRFPLIELAQSFAMAIVLGYVAIKIMGKTPMGKSMILKTTIGENKNRIFHDQIYVGKTGVTLTELYPVGKVEIDGKTYEARAQAGKIEKGEKIKVLQKTDFELSVEREIS